MAADFAANYRANFCLSALLLVTRKRQARGAIAHGQAAMAPDRQRQLVAAMPERQSTEYRHAKARACVVDHGIDVIAVVVGAKLYAAEVAENNSALRLQRAGEMKLIEHPLDAIRMLAGIFDEQNTAVDVRKVRRPNEMRQHGPVSAPENSFGVERARSVEPAIHRVLVRAEQSPAMFGGERRRRFGTEIVRGHRTREADHALMREGGQLKGGEIAVAQPPFPSRGDGTEVDAVEEPRPPVAPAHGDRDVDLRIVGHAHDCGETLIVRR